eukprot:945910-Amphidinium_carterae.2
MATGSSAMGLNSLTRLGRSGTWTRRSESGSVSVCNACLSRSVSICHMSDATMCGRTSAS